MTDELLHGKTLHWVVYDPTNIVASVVNDTLGSTLQDTSIRLQRTRIERPLDLVELLKSCAKERETDPALLVCRLQNDGECQAICQGLSQARQLPRCPVRVVYLEPELEEWSAALIEVGAQIVASQLPSLVKAVNCLIPHMRMGDHGYHPLTSGLIQRLPLGNLEERHVGEGRKGD